MARNLNHFLLRVHKKISIVDELRGTEMSLSRSSHSVSNITQLKPRLPYDLQRVARLSATAEQDWVYSLMEYRIRPTGGTDKVEGQPGLVGGNIVYTQVPRRTFIVHVVFVPVFVEQT